MTASVQQFPTRRVRLLQRYGIPPMPAVHSIRRHNNENSFSVEIPAELSQTTVARIAAARSVNLDTGALEFNPSPNTVPYLKFGILVSLALAPAVLLGAKYFFDQHLVRRNGGFSESTVDAGIIFAAVAWVCGMGCAFTVCRARPTSSSQTPGGHSRSVTIRTPLPRITTRAAATQELVRSNGRYTMESSMVFAAVAYVCGLSRAFTMCRERTTDCPHAPDRMSSITRTPLPRTPTRGADVREVPTSDTTDDISLNVLSQPEQGTALRVATTSGVMAPEAPPPYHIAVSLPPRAPSSPPPPYSELR